MQLRQRRVAGEDGEYPPEAVEQLVLSGEALVRRLCRLAVSACPGEAFFFLGKGGVL